ncbi:hypothetical protein JYT16_01400 [Gemmatimonas aurantiaca]|nr:hypothetical protein [Gemmatimonas aurantiaca]
MAKKLYIIIGCDTDPDRKNFLDNLPMDTLSWRGMLEGAPLLKEKLKDLHDSNGKEPIISWCLRVDYQIKKYYGAYSSIIEKHKELFLNLESSGDELAWHPHFWKDDQATGAWYQECHNVDWQVAMLKDAYADYQRVLPGRAKSVRMGWDYHNNETLGTLENLGVGVDFSGIPGMRIEPSQNHLTAFNSYDWYYAPNRPYFPSRTDYRREAIDSEQSFRILEAPNFVSKSRLWGLLRGLVMAKKMRDAKQLLYALRRPSYWINITGKPTLAQPVFRELEKSLKRNERTFFVSYFHPDELLDNKHHLYSLENMNFNLGVMLRLAEKFNVDLVYLSASEIPKQIGAGHVE